MRGKKHILRPGYFLILFLLVLGSGIWIPRLKYMSEAGRLTENILFTADFRRQPVTEELLKEIKNVDQPGEMLGIYWLETDFGRTEKAFSKMDRSRWTVRPGWSEFAAACRAVWDDAVYFPVAEAANRTDAKVTFEDSWMFGRSYKGDRGHEGTDIMASVNERGLYPVVSMTDGTVRSKGWLELGGWRLGIETEQGAYFYYAHLDSYAQIEEGGCGEGRRSSRLYGRYRLQYRRGYHRKLSGAPAPGDLPLSRRPGDQCRSLWSTEICGGQENQLHFPVGGFMHPEIMLYCPLWRK